MARFELPSGEVLTTTLVLEQNVDGDPPCVPTNMDIRGECIVEFGGTIQSLELALVRRVQTHVGTKSETIVWQNKNENGEVFLFLIEAPTFPYTYDGCDLKVNWFIITTLQVKAGKYFAEKEIILTQPESVEVQNKLLTVADREIAMLADDRKEKLMVYFLGFLIIFAVFPLFSLQIAPIIGAGMTPFFAVFLYRKWKSQKRLFSDVSVEMERSVSPGDCFPVLLRFTCPDQLRNYTSTITFLRRENVDEYQVEEEELFNVSGKRPALEKGNVVSIKTSFNLPVDLKHSFKFKRFSSFELYYVVKFTVSLYNDPILEKEFRVLVVPQEIEF